MTATPDPKSWDWPAEALAAVALSANLPGTTALLLGAEEHERDGRLVEARKCWISAHEDFQLASAEAGRKKDEPRRLVLACANLRCLRHSDRLFFLIRGGKR